MHDIIEEKEKYLNTKEGETLSTDDLSDIYMQVMSEARGKTNMNLATRSKNGEINDYLEVRRPFGAAQWAFSYLNLNLKLKYLSLYIASSLDAQLLHPNLSV